MFLPEWVNSRAKRCPAIADVLKRYPPKSKLGEGAYKWVYASGDVAVGMTLYTQQAKTEIRCLKRLQKIGLPVVEILEWVPSGKRISGGALIMRRYQRPRKITLKIQKQCKNISQVLHKHKIWVNDLHILLNKGKIVIADPLGIEEACNFLDKQEFRFADIGLCGHTIWI